MCTRKSLFLLGGVSCLLTGALWARSEEPTPIQLKGIVAYSTNRFALLENTQGRSFEREFILSEGQRDGSVEIVKIDVPSQRVTIKHEGNIRELTFADVKAAGVEGTLPPGKPAFLRLQKASLSQVLEIYQRLARRSLLRTASLAAPELNLVAGGGSEADLAAAIEKALVKNGIVLRQEGEKFAVVARNGESEKITPQLIELASTVGERHKPSWAASGEEMIPSGTIYFLGLELSQFLQIYAELTGRTILRPSSFPALPMMFRNHTPLTRAEAIYALSAMLAINDISVLPLEEKFLVVFPTAETEKVTALLSRKALAHEVSDKDSSVPGTLDFRSASLEDVMAVYKKLSGQPIEMDDRLGGVTIFLRSQTSLTRAEVLRAFEIVLGLNGLTVVQQEDGHGLKVVRTALR